MSGEDTRLGPQDWQQLQEFYDELEPGAKGSDSLRQWLALGALLDLHDQVGDLQMSLEDLGDRSAFQVRLDALKSAREYVAGLPSEQQNSRGYRDAAMLPSHRVEQEMKVARYLLGESSDVG